MRKLASSVPVLKLNNTLRWVSRIFACLGYIFFVLGVKSHFSDMTWIFFAAAIFLVMTVVCSIIMLNEGRLFDYAENVPIHSLPKPAYDKQFWERRKNSSLLLLGSLFLLGLGYALFVVVSVVSFICILGSIVFLVFHMIVHPKRGNVHSRIR